MTATAAPARARRARQPYGASRRPPGVDYALTPRDAGLRETAQALVAWAEARPAEIAGAWAAYDERDAAARRSAGQVAGSS